MRYPKHIILDLKTTSITNPHLGCEDSLVRLPSLLKLNLKTHSLLYPSSRISVDCTNFFDNGVMPKSTYAQTFTLPLFNIHFLRKEKLYTKLKYSRCPQYDMVSGGFAALLAGFVGFLISEKFGIELVDSGDFYNAFMYGVFAAFSLRPLLRVYSKDNTPYNPLSPKYLILFIKDLLKLCLKGFYSFLGLLKCFF